jgi:hypothetical protein
MVAKNAYTTVCTCFGRSILSCLTLRSFVHLIVKHLIVKHHIVKSDTVVLKLWGFIDEWQVCTMWESGPSFGEVGKARPRGSISCNGKVWRASKWAPPLAGVNIFGCGWAYGMNIFDLQEWKNRVTLQHIYISISCSNNPKWCQSSIIGGTIKYRF